jgi:hypothetical protein
MEANSQRPQKWVEIINEPICRFVIVHVYVLMFKGLVHLPYLFYLAPILIYFTQPNLVCFALALPYLTYTLALI